MLLFFYVHDYNSSSKLINLSFTFYGGKKDRIIGKTLTGKENKGGIDINDFESKLKASKASWIPRLTNTKSSYLPFMENFYHIKRICL